MPPRENQSYPGLEALKRLPVWDGRGFSPLEVPRRLLECLGNPQNKIPAVHVAGTNGKGSTCALIAAMLRAEGASVGQFVSPHLSDVTERCLINGRPQEPARFDQAVQTVLKLAEEEGLTPSYFVVGAVAAFLEFVREEVDWMVIEVGLGGLYDATNTMEKPRATVITSIGIDHTAWLGTSLGEIALNKVGIARSKVPLIVGAVPPEAESTIASYAAEHDVPVEFYGKDYRLEDEVLVTEQQCVSLPALRRLEAGYLRRNAVLAARVAQTLGLSEGAVNEGIERFRWPGRLELLKLPGSKRSILLDAAHNPDGMEAFSEFLFEKAVGVKKLVIVLAVLERKDWQRMAQCLADLEERLVGVEVTWVLSRVDDPLGLDPRELLVFFPEGRVAMSAEDALGVVREEVAEVGECEEGEVLVAATGSIYFLGELRPLVTREGFRSIVG